MNRRSFSRTALTAAVVAALLVSMSPVAGHAASTTLPDDFAVEGPAFAQLRGISLADAEQRLGWQQLAPTLWHNLSVDIPTRLGGVWIDINNGDRVKVGITGRIDSTITATVTREATAVGLTTGYDLVPVARTEATLLSDMTWLASQFAQVNVGAAAPLAAGERTDLNQLQLDLPASGQLNAAQASVVAAAQTRLGPELLTMSNGKPLDLMSCVYPFCDPPLRAGIRIALVNGIPCTGGFTAQSNVDAKEYVITAGHCAMTSFGTNWQTKFTDGSDHIIGSAWHAILSTEHGDEGIISINNVPGWTPQGRVNVTLSAGTTSDPNYFIKADNWSVIGQRICTTGAALGFSMCGQVTELDYTFEAGGYEFDHAGQTSICSVHGDSGAPMYASHIALGILVAGPSNGDCGAIYDGIRNAESQLNVHLLLAAS
jgi:hypothetical protein